MAGKIAGRDDPAPAAGRAASPGSATAADRPRRQPPALLYLVGHHKSGSTALGAMLGGHPELFFAGEVYRFPYPIWTPGDPRRICSCGQPVLQCPFWTTVRARFEAKHSLGSLRAGQERWERWRALPRAVLARGAAREELSQHVTAMEDLLGILSEESGSPMIVESSFAALRGWLYSLHGPDRLRVKYLHLVRDGRAFLWSEMKIKEPPEFGGNWIRSPPFAIARWVFMNLLAIALCARGRDRYLRVRYEELVSDPRGTLERIGRFIGLDLSDVGDRLEHRVPIPLRHIAAGSWHRLEGAIVLRPDFSWRTGLPRATRTLFWMTSGWFARLLGYRRAPPA